MLVRMKCLMLLGMVGLLVIGIVWVVVVWMGLEWYFVQVVVIGLLMFQWWYSFRVVLVCSYCLKVRLQCCVRVFLVVLWLKVMWLCSMFSGGEQCVIVLMRLSCCSMGVQLWLLVVNSLMCCLISICRLVFMFCIQVSWFIEVFMCLKWLLQVQLCMVVIGICVSVVNLFVQCVFLLWWVYQIIVFEQKECMLNSMCVLCFGVWQGLMRMLVLFCFSISCVCDQGIYLQCKLLLKSWLSRFIVRFLGVMFLVFLKMCVNCEFIVCRGVVWVGCVSVSFVI